MKIAWREFAEEIIAKYGKDLTNEEQSGMFDFIMDLLDRYEGDL